MTTNFREIPRVKELCEILNSEPFGTDAWHAASDEKRELFMRHTEEHPVELGDKWCTTDGKWWN
jgi:hypothetical protein